MKILYVITKSNWGGAQRHVYDLATSMKAKGHDVWVAAGGEGLLKIKLENAGIYTFSIAPLGRDISFKQDYQSFRAISSIIKEKRPDVIHLHSPKAAGLGAMAGRLRGVKNIITTVHGWTFNEKRNLIEKGLIMLVSWLTMLISHKTVLLSEREFDQASYFPWVKDKITVIPLGIKMPTFMSIDGSKQTLSKTAGIDLGDFNKRTIIGTIAELNPNKGISYLIDAMSSVAEQHPQSLCLVIGDGDDLASMHLKIKEMHLENNIKLLGFMDNASEYLKAINIFVLPSLKEGLPYSILEAGCAGLPVIATTVGGVPEIIEDMKSGILIQAKNHRELAHALSFMIEHPDERKGYGQSLKERIALKFSMEKMVWMVERLYSKNNQ